MKKMRFLLILSFVLALLADFASAFVMKLSLKPNFLFKPKISSSSTKDFSRSPSATQTHATRCTARMGIHYSTLVAYGVVIDESIKVDEGKVENAGFRCIHAEHPHKGSEAFVYLGETRVDLDADTAVEEIAEPIDEKETKNDETIGARISVPRPTKQACEALKKFVVDNKLAEEEDAYPTPKIFFSAY